MIYAIFQNVVIALVVAYSAMYLWRKLLPRKAAAPAAACDSGCSICNQCAPAVAAESVAPIRLVQ